MEANIFLKAVNVYAKNNSFNNSQIEQVESFGFPRPVMHFDFRDYDKYMAYYSHISRIYNMKSITRTQFIEACFQLTTRLFPQYHNDVEFHQNLLQYYDIICKINCTRWLKDYFLQFNKRKPCNKCLTHIYSVYLFDNNYLIVRRCIAFPFEACDVFSDSGTIATVSCRLGDRDMIVKQIKPVILKFEYDCKRINIFRSRLFDQANNNKATDITFAF